LIIHPSGGKALTMASGRPAKIDVGINVNVDRGGQSTLSGLQRPAVPSIRHPKQQFGKDVTECPRPSGWCVHEGATYSLNDCDGDGVLDPTCSDSSGQFGVISSADNCKLLWPNATCGSVCPRPSGFCALTGSTYSLKDCDGDGILDPTCTGFHGKFGIVSSAANCKIFWPNAKCVSAIPGISSDGTSRNSARGHRDQSAKGPIMKGSNVAMSPDKMDWFQAKEYCLDIGGTLCEVHSAHEEKELEKLLDDKDETYWLGLTDEKEEGKFVWITSNKPLTMSYWAPGEPSNGGGNEDCVEIVNGLWNDINCTNGERCHALCETH